MRDWGRCLLSCLLLLASGCDGLGEHFEYRGARLLDEGDYQVSTAHWLDSLPVVFASRREQPGEPRVLRFVPLSDVGIEPCSTMAGTGYIAVGREGAFRMAVINDRDSGRELDFFDAECNRVGPAFDDAVNIDYVAEYQFLVQTLDGTAWIVEPFDGRVHLLGEEVLAIGLPRTDSRELMVSPPPLAAWVLEPDGLQLRDMRGRSLTRKVEGATRLTLYRGVAGGSKGLVGYQGADGVHLLEYDLTLPPDDDGLHPLTSVWSAEGACGPRFFELDDFGEVSCEGPDCIEPQDSDVMRGPHAWVGMYQPCDERRLLLRRVQDSATFIIDDAVREYRISVQGTEDGPVIFYGKDVPVDGADVPDRKYFFRNGEQPPIAIEVPLDLDLMTEDPQDFPRMRITTAEQPRRFGVWDPESGFEALRDDVYGARMNAMVLHGYDDETRTGTLSLCEGACFDVAKDVRVGGYRMYTALERIGDGPILLAFIHDYAIDEETGVGGGRLTVVNTANSISVDLDDRVSSFVPIENGPARGLVYAVSDSERQGLWFAPR